MKGEKANEWHPDIKKLIEPHSLKYARNAGEVLHLSNEFVDGINEFLQYVEDRIIDQLEWEAEIRRGK